MEKTIVKVIPCKDKSRWDQKANTYYLRTGTENYNFSYNEVLPEVQGLLNLKVDHPDWIFSISVSDFPPATQKALVFLLEQQNIEIK